MKKLIIVLGLMLVCGTAYAQEDASLGSKLWTAVGSPVKAVVVVTHEALHIVQNVAGGVMTVAHSALDVLGIPWSDN